MPTFQERLCPSMLLGQDLDFRFRHRSPESQSEESSRELDEGHGKGVREVVPGAAGHQLMSGALGLGFMGFR